MIYALIKEHGVEASSEPAIEIGYRMMYAAYMRLEGSGNDVASRVDAGLTQGAGLYMGGESSARPAKAPNFCRRMNGKE